MLTSKLITAISVIGGPTVAVIFYLWVVSRIKEVASSEVFAGLCASTMTLVPLACFIWNLVFSSLMFLLSEQPASAQTASVNIEGNEAIALWAFLYAFVMSLAGIRRIIRAACAKRVN